jgi:hypothetical protein
MAHCPPISYSFKRSMRPSRPYDNILEDLSPSPIQVKRRGGTEGRGDEIQKRTREMEGQGRESEERAQEELRRQGEEQTRKRVERRQKRVKRRQEREERAQEELRRQGEEQTRKRVERRQKSMAWRQDKEEWARESGDLTPESEEWTQEREQQLPMPVASIAPPGRGVLMSPGRRRFSPSSTYSSIAVHKMESTEDIDDAIPVAPLMDSKVETRSLNLVCYRQGQQGCKSYQVQVARWRKDVRIEHEDDIHRAVAGFPQLSVTNEAFMRALRRGYEKRMCGFWSRLFSLKSPRFVRLRSVYHLLHGMKGEY